MKKMNSFTKNLLAAVVALTALTSVACKKDVPAEKQKNNADILDGKTFYVYSADTTNEAAVDTTYFDFKFSKDSEDSDGNKVSMYYIDNYYSYLDISVTKTGKNTYSLSGGEQIGKLLGKTDVYHYISLSGTYNSSTDDISFEIKQWKELNDSTEDIYSYKTIKYATYTLDTLKSASFDNITISANGSFNYADNTYNLSNSKLVGANVWKITGDTDSVILKINKNYASIKLTSSTGYGTYDLITLKNFMNVELTSSDLTSKTTTKMTITPKESNGGITGTIALTTTVASKPVTATYYYFNDSTMKQGLNVQGVLLNTSDTKPLKTTDNIVFTIVSETALKAVITINGTKTTSVFTGE